MFTEAIEEVESNLIPKKAETSPDRTGTGNADDVNGGSATGAGTTTGDADQQTGNLDDFTDDPIKALKLVHVVVPTAQTDENSVELRRFFDEALQRRCKFCKVFIEKSSEGACAAEMLKCTHVFQVGYVPQPNKDGFAPYTAVTYHPWKMGESITQPWNRRHHYQPDRFRKLTRAIMIAFAVKTELPNHVLFALHDGMKPGNKISMLSAFDAPDPQAYHKRKPLPRVDKTTVVMFDPAQLEERLGTVRGVNHVNFEFINFVTASAISVPIKTRKWLQGDNKWNVMQVVQMTEWKDAWHLTMQDKKKLVVGNRVDVNVVVKDTGDKRTRALTDREPVFYHSHNMFFHHTFDDDNNVERKCDLSMGEGESGVVAAERGMPWCGMALSASHQQFVEKHMTHMIFKLMATEGSLIYEPALAKILTADWMSRGRSPIAVGSTIVKQHCFSEQLHFIKIIAYFS